MSGRSLIKLRTLFLLKEAKSSKVQSSVELSASAEKTVGDLEWLSLEMLSSLLVATRKFKTSESVPVYKQLRQTFLSRS